jgi:hypothetical protein
MDDSSSNTASWIFLVLGVGGMIFMTVLKVQSLSFDSSGKSILDAQKHYEFSQVMETVYKPSMILFLVITIISAITFVEKRPN